jgi:hypothetical protein
MNPKMRRNFSGDFMPQDLGRGAWRLLSKAPRETSIYLQGTEGGAARSFGTTPLRDLGIEWRGETALLSFMSDDRVGTVEAGSAIVHQPLGQLYDSLPLQSVDANARRFWRRVFRLVRIPGGRFLLTLLARPRRR